MGRIDRAERARRRAQLLEDLALGRQVRARLHPRRTKIERERNILRMRTVRV